MERFKFDKNAKAQNETDLVIQDIQKEIKQFNKFVNEPFTLVSLSYEEPRKKLQELLEKLKETNAMLWEKLNAPGLEFNPYKEDNND